MPDLVCPACHGRLMDSDDLRRCEACGVDYPTTFGIPVMIAPVLRSAHTAADESVAQKARQIEYFDQPSDDFGVTRPRGAPALYGMLLREKFRRSVIGLEDLLPGAAVLVACGGAGLDAEFLVEAGARVILSDISPGVLLQAQERSRRFGLDLELVVADAEALPFADHSVDVVYVHDGLHHLEQPDLGLAEMARVAAVAVSISEPSQSAVTALAVRLGLAEAREEAGNVVARLELDSVVDELRRAGFEPVRPHRYLMLYRHWPGRVMRALSIPVLRTLAIGVLRIVNRGAGRWGNKLTVQARRRSA